MPIYKWTCQKCKAVVEVIRAFDGFRDPPTSEDATACPDGEHDWDKNIGTPKVVRGHGWGGGKGNWALLLLFAAAALLSGCRGITPTDWAAGETVCAGRGGVAAVWPDGDFDLKVSCGDGATFNEIYRNKVVKRNP